MIALTLTVKRPPSPPPVYTPLPSLHTEQHSKVSFYKLTNSLPSPCCPTRVSFRPIYFPPFLCLPACVCDAFIGTQFGTIFPPAPGFIPFCMYPFQHGSFVFLAIYPLLPQHPTLVDPKTLGGRLYTLRCHRLRLYFTLLGPIYPEGEAEHDVVPVPTNLPTQAPAVLKSVIIYDLVNKTKCPSWIASVPSGTQCRRA